MKKITEIVIFIIGITTTLVSLLVRLNARNIAWPKSASWGSQIEATPFYSKQIAVADAPNLFLTFGLTLVAGVLIHRLCQTNKSRQKDEAARKLSYHLNVRNTKRKGSICIFMIL